MIVTLGCEKCGRTATVVVFGGWDLADVRHECPKPGKGELDARGAYRPDFAVTFDPPRRVF